MLKGKPRITPKSRARILLGVFITSLTFSLSGAMTLEPIKGAETDDLIAPGVEDPWEIKYEQQGTVLDLGSYYDMLPDLRAQAVTVSEPIVLEVNDMIDSLEERVIELDVPEAGSYHMKMVYQVPGETIMDLKLDLQINGEIPYFESQDVVLPVAWRTVEGERNIDQYGNETYPVAVRIHESFEHTLVNDMFNSSDPLLFSFENGWNELTITNNEMPFTLERIILHSNDEIPAYDGYVSELNQGTPQLASTPLLTEEGEKFSFKSHAHIRGERTKNIHYMPFDPELTLINVLAENMWQAPGESVTYEFDVPSDGFYRIGLRYLQGLKQEMPVFKDIYVNGEMLFQELQNYSVPYTRNNVTVHWVGESSEQGEYLIYLEEGPNTITFESTASLYFEPYELLLRTIQEMNLITLDIKMITGNRVDQNRDWAIEQYIPDISDRILALVDNLDVIYDQLIELAGGERVSQWSNLLIIRDSIERYTIDRTNDRGLDRLVNNLEVFSQGDGSLAEQLAQVLQDMLSQPMAIDQVYLAGEDLSELPSSPGFFEATWLNIQKLFASFTYENPNFEIEEEALNIWVNRPVTFIDVLREMINQQYPDPNVKINLSAMPDENRLLMSVIAGEAPDGVLGLTTGKPYDFALRGAAHDLRNFSDFEEVTEDFTAEMFVPFAYDDGIYALPETATFFVLFYRTDIMQRLGLEVPRTWDELINILPDLDRQGLNVQTMIAGTDAFKHFGTTVPFIQQHEGELYHDDGLSVYFDHPNTIESFELLTDLYIRYNLPNRIANFYVNFKSGLTPLGVSDLGTYILLQNAAPEINGQWSIAPNLGRVNEKGEFINTQPDITSGVMITEQSQMKDEAWEFMKWWMSDEVQLQYGNELQMRFGKEYVWATANLAALQEVPYIDRADRDIIVEQVRIAQEIPRHPAYFQVERELSNAWNTVVFDGTPVREALDRAALSSNRMMRVKLQEFGYLDPQGNVLKPLKIPNAEDIEQFGNFISSAPGVISDYEREE